MSTQTKSKSALPNETRADEILLKSAELFRRQGFQSTSIRDIGNALQFTSAALYYHFKNKDEILLGVMDRGLDVLIERVQSAIESAKQKDETSWQQLRAAVNEHFRTSIKFQDAAIVIMRETRHLKEDNRNQIIAKRDRYERILGDLIEQAQSSGEIRNDVDTKLFRLSLIGAMNQAITWFQPEGELSETQFSNQLIDLFGSGVQHQAQTKGV